MTSEVSSQSVRKVLMTNSQSRVLDLLETKKRKLEWITASRQRMLENVSSASVLVRLKRVGIIPTTRRGRKKLATDKRRFYMIGCAVDQMFSRLESAFRISKELKIANGNWDLSTLRSELAKHLFTPTEIDAVLQSRTRMGAAKRLVAKSLTSRAHPNGISLQTVNSCYSRYLKALESERTSL